MAVCWLSNSDNSTILILDATESLQYTRSADVSTSTIFSGAQKSDNVTPRLPIVTFSGITTYTKIRDTYPDPKEYRQGVDSLIDSQELMTFHGTSDNVIPSMDNCYITNFTGERSDKTSSGLQVTITIQQLDLSTAATSTTIENVGDAAMADGDNGQNGNKSSTSTGSTTEKPMTLSATGISAVGKLFSK